MDNGKYKYILRYAIDPLNHANSKVDSLLDFCETVRKSAARGYAYK